MNVSMALLLSWLRPSGQVDVELGSVYSSQWLEHHPILLKAERGSDVLTTVERMGSEVLATVECMVLAPVVWLVIRRPV